MRRVIDSPIGRLTLVADEDIITGLYFGDVADSQSYGYSHRVLDQCERELEAYFKGELMKFSVPVDARGTPFRERVWEVLRRIPYGVTVSYKDVAARMGSPKAVRAVGGANHNNPVSIIIPCHRVVGSNGSLTGYGGGMEAKRWLLEMEAKYASKSNKR